MREAPVLSLSKDEPKGWKDSFLRRRFDHAPSAFRSVREGQAQRGDGRTQHGA